MRVSVPTRSDLPRPDADGRRPTSTPPRRPSERPSAPLREHSTLAARLAGAIVVLAALLAAFGGWLAVLL
jgi:hypothetical protein